MYYNLNQTNSKWIICLNIWRIILNEIIITTTQTPVVCGCDFLAASEPFFHADRILDFNVLIYVSEGTIFVTENETDYEVNAGELLFLKKGVRHYGKKEIPRGTKWYYVHFYLDEPESRCNDFKEDTAPVGVYEPIACSAVIPKKLSGLENGIIQHKLSELAKYCRSEDAFKRMRINLMLHSLLTDIALLKLQEEKEDTLSEKICGWLNEHCTEPFSAVKLEREFYLSYKRLAAVFKKECGETMQQYHTRRRMSYACRLLRSTLFPIKEIAERLGYEDPLYFSKCFRAFSGLPPRDYRSIARSDY